MNSRFVFRLWSNRLKRYLGQSPCIGLEEGCFANVHTLEDNQVIEQCTGLRDKNGKLVFEGDIIQDWNRALYRVFWFDGLAQFCIAPIVYNEDTKEYADVNFHSLHQSFDERYHVVGNIHEGAKDFER